MIQKGSWVQIHKIILKPVERTAALPEETKKVPLELWVKGFLQSDAEMNDTVEIKTITGRLEQGTLVACNPSYAHNYGAFVGELLTIDQMVTKAVFGDNHE